MISLRMYDHFELKSIECVAVISLIKGGDEGKKLKE